MRAINKGKDEMRKNRRYCEKLQKTIASIMIKKFHLFDKTSSSVKITLKVLFKSKHAQTFSKRALKDEIL